MNEQRAPGARRTLIILAVVYAIAFVDRAVLGIVAQPMQRDLGLSDTEFSLITGFAFTLLYAIAGVPIGRLMDRYARVPLLAIGIGFWSVMTVLCGLAGSFLTLFLARLGVGLGEATLNPGAGSILADSFPRSQLGRAMAIYTLGGFVGGGLALMGGGALLAWFALARPAWLGGLADWQALFLVLGGISLLLVPLILSVREPTRPLADAAEAQPTLTHLVSFFRANRRALIALMFGIACLAAIFAAVQAWVPTLLARRFNIGPAEAAFWFGLAFATAGAIGNLAGGASSMRCASGAMPMPASAPGLSPLSDWRLLLSPLP